MHHALEIQEILLAIFSYCQPCLPSRRGSDLPALARTCRIFREPALDVLWETLDELSPLVRCLPEACVEVSEMVPLTLFLPRAKYHFNRPPDQTEWATLRGYARRVRSIVEVQNRLDVECFRTLSNTPTAEPLFPNLRHLRCKYTDDAAPLLHLSFPSLTSLDLVFADPSAFWEYLDSFHVHAPDVRRVSFRVRQPEGAFLTLGPRSLVRLGNLESIVCPQIVLSADALVHLSRMSSLVRLTFTLVAPPPTTNESESLVFQTLHYLTVHAASLFPIARLLAMVKTPALTDLAACVDACPSRAELTSFMAGIQTCGACDLVRIALEQAVPSMAGRLLPPTDNDGGSVLELAHLRSLASLPALRALKLDVAWAVGLRDADVLALAEAWPRLEHLVINASAGWHRGAGAGGGVTPEGLRGVLRACPRLRWAALALDARGYAARPLRPGDGGTSRTLTLDVADSPIEADSVFAVAAFLADVAGEMSLRMWRGGGMVRPGGWETYRERWEDVVRLSMAGRLVEEQSSSS